MLKAVLLRLHRWITLVFALPLLVVIVTGLMLSFQPMVQSLSVVRGSLEPARIDALLQRHDPEGKARGLSIDPYANRMRLATAGGAIDVDLATGEKAGAPSALADLFQWARRTHERLIFGMGWLVTASTIAMLMVITLGVLMGLPRLRNSLSGWHKGVAWFALPLVILSPLTGLFLAFGVTFNSAGAPAARGRPIPLRDAVQTVAVSHDVSTINSIGQRGGRMMVRLNEGGELRAYALTAEGLAPLGRNWPRLIHEGNWSGVVAGALNVITSVALLGLLTTGMLIWARRTFRRRPQRARGRQEAVGTGRERQAA
jgi:uncharacterized iron-regulated membrane protein